MEDLQRRFQPWSEAPVGALLQTNMIILNSPDQPVVRGIRCDPNGRPSLLVLGGDERPPLGYLLSADLSDNEAVDISEQYEVRLSPKRYGPWPPLKIGSAYSVMTRYGRVVAMRAKPYSGPSEEEFWIGLFEPSRGKVINGVPEDEIDRADLVRI